MAWLWCIVLLAVGVSVLHPRVFSAVGNFVLRRLGLTVQLAPFRLRDYLRPLGVILVGQVLAGLGLWLMVRSVADVSPGWIAVCTAASGLAGSLGFLAVFAPGGLGVREGILFVILGRFLRPGDAAVVVIVARLVLTAVELIMAGAGLILWHVFAKGRQPIDEAA